MLNGSIGSVNYAVESTGLYFAPPSSGTADTTLGTINLVLSDLHMAVSDTTYFFDDTDFDIWNISTSTIDANSYNSATGAFVYGWSDNASIPFGGSNFPLAYSFEISGTASSVPLPAAVWLFGSGIAGLIVFRKKFSK